MGFFKEARDAFVTAWHEEFDGKDVKKEFRDAFIEGWENGWSGGSGIYENGREVSNAEMERRRRAHDEQEAAYMREQVVPRSRASRSSTGGRSRSPASSRSVWPAPPPSGTGRTETA